VIQHFCRSPVRCISADSTSEQFIPAHTLDTALNMITPFTKYNIMKTADEGCEDDSDEDPTEDVGCVLVGYGQQYRDRAVERLLVLDVDGDFLEEYDANLFESELVFDGLISQQHVDELFDTVTANAERSLYHCEFDFINTSDWRFGMTVKPFSIFSADERLCVIDTEEREVYISSDGATEDICIEDITSVYLMVSDEPYTQRTLGLGLQDDSKIAIIDYEDFKEITDLAQLTVETEWLMKAAGSLCKNLQMLSDKKIEFKMSSCLHPSNNEWVAMRQKLWVDAARGDS